MTRTPLYVTQPTLAPLPEVVSWLEQAWASGILTHNGPLMQRFERECVAHLGLARMVAVANGTIAIQMAIRALELSGEIITTPFTFIASLSAIQWERCTPVFADIDPGTLNIDPAKIEAAITPNTVAIMPVHVFGNPCDVDAIQAIAARHGLKVIYDAAHAVGVTYRGQSLLNYGDISATSFHATKMLNTAEGGGCIAASEALHERLRAIRFFGFDDSKDVVCEGFNGKMTEVHAALGLANLPYLPAALEDRKRKYLRYRQLLEACPGISFQVINESCNYSYFPIILESEEMTLRISRRLEEDGVFARRYFHPSVNTFSAVVAHQPMPVSEDISRRILCLPLYLTLAEADIVRIASLIADGLAPGAG